MSGIDLATVETKIERGDLQGAVTDLMLHVKLLIARVEDLRTEVRTQATRKALLTGLDKRRR